MKIIGYYEGAYNPHRGKFLNAIVRYKKEMLLGVYSKVPSESLLAYLAQHKIKFFSELNEELPACTHFVLLPLNFANWELIYRDVVSILEYAAKKNIIVVNGTFKLLSNRFPQYQSVIWDIRKHDPDYHPEHFKDQLRKKPGQLRILTVGTDATVGKMTAGLELEAALLKRGYDARLVATGQIGIFLKGNGIALDSTIIDFSRGILEDHLLQYDNKILIVEGQGSIFHPVYFGAASTLIYGTAPQLMLLCSRLNHKNIRSVPQWPIPELPEVIRRTEEMARDAYPDAQIFALTINTSEVDEEAALKEIEQHEQQLNLPATDVLRFGAEKLVDALEKHIKNQTINVN